MAETFSKRERTKKKNERKREKALRREERRNMVTKTKSLEEMLAYVDENGNLSDTPPDPARLRKVAAADIAVSVPKTQPEDPDAPLAGIVSYFDPAKGYGFINNEDTKERLFVHVSGLAQPGMELSVGDRVSYTAARSPRGMQAVSVAMR